MINIKRTILISVITLIILNFSFSKAGVTTSSKSGVTAMSASGSTYTHANAAKYCYGLSAPAQFAMDGDTTTVYDDWRLPNIMEAAVFEGTATDNNYIWTATVYEANYGDWQLLRLADGGWTYTANTYSYFVRCVR